jgi:hypothetical protein
LALLCLLRTQVIYLSSLIRCTIALHNLVNNKIKYRELEDVNFADKKDDKKDTEKPKDDKKDADKPKDAKKKPTP